MSKPTRDDSAPAGWRPPTRRVFLGLIGAGAAALAGRAVLPVAPAPPVAIAPRKYPWMKTRWIGHC